MKTQGTAVDSCRQLPTAVARHVSTDDNRCIHVQLSLRFLLVHGEHDQHGGLATCQGVRARKDVHVIKEISLDGRIEAGTPGILSKQPYSPCLTTVGGAIARTGHRKTGTRRRIDSDGDCTLNTTSDDTLLGQRRMHTKNVTAAGALVCDISVRHARGSTGAHAHSLAIDAHDFPTNFIVK
jgi:hypothetical protein